MFIHYKFKTRESAEKAKQELQGRDLLGRPVKIGWKNPLSMEPSVTFNSEEGFVLVAPSVAARHGIKVGCGFSICLVFAWLLADTVYLTS